MKSFLLSLLEDPSIQSAVCCVACVSGHKARGGRNTRRRWTVVWSSRGPSWTLLFLCSQVANACSCLPSFLFHFILSKHPGAALRDKTRYLSSAFRFVSTSFCEYSETETQQYFLFKNIKIPSLSKLDIVVSREKFQNGKSRRRSLIYDKSTLCWFKNQSNIWQAIYYFIITPS